MKKYAFILCVKNQLSRLVCVESMSEAEMRTAKTIVCRTARLFRNTASILVYVHVDGRLYKVDDSCNLPYSMYIPEDVQIFDGKIFYS